MVTVAFFEKNDTVSTTTALRGQILSKRVQRAKILDTLTLLIMPIQGWRSYQVGLNIELLVHRDGINRLGFL